MMVMRLNLPTLVMGMMVTLPALIVAPLASAVDAQAAKELAAFDPATPAKRIATIPKGTDIDIADEDPVAGMMTVSYVGADGAQRIVLCRSADLGIAEETVRVVGPIPSVDDAL